MSAGLSPPAIGSKSHSAAILDRKPLASNSEIGRVAVRPEVSRFQNCLTPIPPGATTPIPVTTARRLIRGVPLGPGPPCQRAPARAAAPAGRDGTRSGPGPYRYYGPGAACPAG